MADRDIPEEMEREVASALHADWCGCDSWDGEQCEEYHESEFPEAAAAGLTPIRRWLAGRQVVDLPAGDVDELAARVLDEHLLTGPRPGQCRCGWGDGSDVRTLGRSHSKHVVEQFRTAGVLAAGSGSGED